jgi:hypothetical protein
MAGNDAARDCGTLVHRQSAELAGVHVVLIGSAKKLPHVICHHSHENYTFQNTFLKHIFFFFALIFGV